MSGRNMVCFPGDGHTFPRLAQLSEGLPSVAHPSPQECPYLKFNFSRPRQQYSSSQMEEAMADVDRGKAVRKAAADHGIPLRSLYHRLKVRSMQKRGHNNRHEIMGTERQSDESEIQHQGYSPPGDSLLEWCWKASPQMTDLMMLVPVWINVLSAIWYCLFLMSFSDCWWPQHNGLKSTMD